MKLALELQKLGAVVSHPPKASQSTRLASIFAWPWRNRNLLSGWSEVAFVMRNIYS